MLADLRSDAPRSAPLHAADVEEAAPDTPGEKQRARSRGRGVEADDSEAPVDCLNVNIETVDRRFAVVGLDAPTTGSCSLLLAWRVGRRFFYVGRVEWSATRSVTAQIREHCTSILASQAPSALPSSSRCLRRPRLVTTVRTSLLRLANRPRALAPATSTPTTRPRPA